MVPIHRRTRFLPLRECGHLREAFPTTLPDRSRFDRLVRFYDADLTEKKMALHLAKAMEARAHVLTRPWTPRR